MECGDASRLSVGTSGGGSQLILKGSEKPHATNRP
jgi:hypothetical protein